jgi:iron complex outermembrane receptor protein
MIGLAVLLDSTAPVPASKYRASTGMVTRSSTNDRRTSTYPRRMMPQWTRFDLGARYSFENPGARGKMLVARFDVDNILDANYWAGSNQTATFMFLGAPRTFRLSLTADF